MKEGLQAKTEALATPYGFAMGALGLKLYPWQADVLAALDPPKASVALKAANGSGKSSKVGVCAALWNAAVFPGSLTIVTASVFRQVKEQFFPAVRSLAHVFPGWKFLDTEVESPTGSRIYGFSTDDAGRFEGWHNENLMMICDEAKSIPGPIFDSIERCQPTRLLLMSSPGPAMGRFYEAFTRHKDALIAQLSTRRAALNSRGQLQLESKPHLRSRGIPSPDRADAILGAMFGFQKPQLLLA